MASVRPPGNKKDGRLSDSLRSLGTQVPEARPFRAPDHGKQGLTVASIYLSSDNPWWMPKTEADLQAAVDGGLFEESHHLDLKKAPNSKGDNKELARDLASFAVDGGTLIIGVQENKDSRTFELAPQPLNGLPEKIEQVARTIPDPPLTVLTEEISSAADDGTGLLQPDSARKLRGHHPCPPVRAGQAPGGWPGSRDPCGCRLSGPGIPDRRACGDTTAPQVQEECPGLVRGDARASAQSALLAAYSRRAWHRTPEELAGAGPPPRPPRAHERHRASRRWSAVPPADHGPDPGTAGVMAKSR